MASLQVQARSLPAETRQTRWTYRRILYLFFFLSLPLVNPIVHGDGVGYYAYLRAPLIEHRLSFEEDWRHANPNFYQARVGADGQLLDSNYTETGHVNNLFTVGPAILWSVFLVPVHLFILLLNALGPHIPANGFSPPYILAMAVGTAVYGFLALLLSFTLAGKYVGEKWAFLATLGVWFASSLPVYMYFNPAWSHAHSAFAVALFLWYWERTRGERSISQWILLGLISGLMVDVYFPNGVFLLLPLIESSLGYFSWQRIGLGGVRTLLGRNVIFLATIFVATLPTYITRKIIFGGFLRFGSYTHLPWDWSAPHWKSVLFSADHGLVSWTPLIGFAILGLAFASERARAVAAYFALGFAAFYYVISSYPYWDGLASFGNRFFISVTPVFIFGLAQLLAFMGDRFSSERRAFVLQAAFLAIFIVWNLGFIFQWGTHLIVVRGDISWPDMVHNQVVVVPRQLSHQLRSFFLRRTDLMHQIEQKDIEQLRKSAEP